MATHSQFERSIMTQAFENALSQILGGKVTFVDCTPKPKKKIKKTSLYLTDLIKSKEGYNPQRFDSILSIVEQFAKDKPKIKLQVQIQCFEDEIQINTDKLGICLNPDTIMYYLGQYPSSEKDIKSYKITPNNIKKVFNYLFINLCPQSHLS